MDIRIANHGSIVILHAISPTGYVVEPRYVEPIIEGAIADGLEVS